MSLRSDLARRAVNVNLGHVRPLQAHFSQMTKASRAQGAQVPFPGGNITLQRKRHCTSRAFKDRNSENQPNPKVARITSNKE